jgi:HEAT repeat protein
MLNSKKFVGFAESRNDTMSLYPELDTLSLDKLIARFRGAPAEGKQYATAYYMEVAHTIRRKMGKESVTFLESEFDKVKDAPRLRALISALAAPPAVKSLERRLLSFLKDKRPLIVMEAIDGLRLLKSRRAHGDIKKLFNTRSPFVRGGVLRYMTQLYPHRAFPLLAKAAKDTHYIVRQVAADELGEIGNARAIHYLRPLQKDKNASVKQAASTAMEMFS